MTYPDRLLAGEIDKHNLEERYVRADRLPVWIPLDASLVRAPVDRPLRGRDRSGRKTYGVGLGLNLSRRIVRAHGGELTLTPAPEGGSVFSFELEFAG